MSGSIPLSALLEALADFDQNGGASLSLVAWDLCVDERRLAPTWQQAAREGLIRPAGHEDQDLLYRLTDLGWGCRDERERQDGA